MALARPSKVSSKKLCSSMLSTASETSQVVFFICLHKTRDLTGRLLRSVIALMFTSQKCGTLTNRCKKKSDLLCTSMQSGDCTVLCYCDFNQASVNFPFGFQSGKRDVLEMNCLPLMAQSAGMPLVHLGA